MRRSSRMTSGQEAAWAEHADAMLIQVERAAGSTSIADNLEFDIASAFGRVAPLIVEIGIGMGEAVVHAAKSHPDMNVLGIEVYRPGLAKTMLRAADAGVTNLRVIEANAPEVFEKLLSPGSVSELRVFFPDPWHKARHTKRRLIAPDFLEIVARALEPGGIVRLATDWQHYADQMREVFEASPKFEPAFEGTWAPRFDGRPVTKFERKGIQAGRTIRDLTYRRVYS